MLSIEEKAYCRALEALVKRDYVLADKEFSACGKLFLDSRGFTIMAEATHLLTAIYEEREKNKNIKHNIMEAVPNGKETIIR